MSVHSNLPRLVRDIIDLVGIGPALALVCAYPGNIIKVPTGARQDGEMRARLVSIMGLEAATKFIAVYKGERLAIPRCAQALRDERDNRIIDAYNAGKSVSKLVVEYGITERWLRNILKRVPGASVNELRPQAVTDRQLGLF